MNPSIAYNKTNPVSKHFVESKSTYKAPVLQTRLVCRKLKCLFI